MIFKMKTPYKSEEQHYLLIEEDSNGTFFGVYKDVESAKKCDGAIALVVIPRHVVDSCQDEFHESAYLNGDQAKKNAEERQLIEVYA